MSIYRQFEMQLVYFTTTFFRFNEYFMLQQSRYGRIVKMMSIFQPMNNNLVFELLRMGHKIYSMVIIYILYLLPKTSFASVININVFYLTRA